MKGHPISDRQRHEMYDAYCNGVKVPDIAQQYGVTENTVYRNIRRQREMQERKGGTDMMSSGEPVAGDRRNGRLVTTGRRGVFEGTCIVDGKAVKRRFKASDKHDAIAQWEQWKAELNGLGEFMDMVERRKPEPQATVEWTGETTPEPVERRGVESRQEPSVLVIGPEVVPTPKPVITGQPKEEKEDRDVAYVIWARSEQPRMYGLYRTMESALAELDRLNDVARFLGSADAFEVEEVAWKG